MCSEVYYNNKRFCMRVCVIVCVLVCKIHKKKSQKSRKLGGRQFCNCVSLFMHELCACVWECVCICAYNDSNQMSSKKFEFWHSKAQHVCACFSFCVCVNVHYKLYLCSARQVKFSLFRLLLLRGRLKYGKWSSLETKRRECCRPPWLRRRLRRRSP